MFKNELEYKRALAGALEVLGWRVQEHEDSLANFIPDLSFSANFVDGWVEVKYLHKVPKSLKSVKHYTLGQEDFLVQRGQAGSGHCYLLVGTPEASYLWRWPSLRNARAATWAGAVELCELVQPDAPGSVALLAVALNARIRLRTGPA